MERARTTESLYSFSRKLAGAGTLDDVLWATAYQTALMLKVRVVLLLPDDGSIAVKAGYPPEDILDDADIAAAKWAWENNRAAGRGSDTLPGAKRLFLPMHTGRGAIGVMGIDSDKPGPLLTPDQRRLLDALRDQGALAIERVKLVEEMDRVERAAETERLRSALLTSISHDLKTPLAAVLGAAGTLRESRAKARRRREGGPPGDDHRRIRAAQPLHRQPARHDQARIRRGHAQCRAARYRRDRRQRIAPRQPHSVAPQRRARARSGSADARTRCRAVRAGRCSISSTMPRNTRRRRRRSAFRAGAAGIRSACACSTREAALRPTDLEHIFDKFYRAQKTDQVRAGTGPWARHLARLRGSHARHHRCGKPLPTGRGAAFTISLPIPRQRQRLDAAA